MILGEREGADVSSPCGSNSLTCFLHLHGALLKQKVEIAPIGKPQVLKLTPVFQTNNVAKEANLAQPPISQHD